jgi:aspartate kinase
MQQLLDAGNIVIAAGFQGIDEDFNITTLGRGGSDTTAVALAAVLNAAECEIYTDVDGVYTTDPRLLPEARRVDRIAYDEMLELASLGAGVMHNRSIEFGKKFGVPIHVRSSMTDTAGTMIVAEPEDARQPVCGAALTRDEARVTVFGVPDVPGSSLMIFSPIAAKYIAVDMIVQNVAENGRADISFTVPKKELRPALEAIAEAVQAVGATSVTSDENVAKVSVVGLGMARQTGVANKMFRALADEGVNIQMITTSEIKISVLVASGDALKALRAVHHAFALAQEPHREPVALDSGPPVRKPDAAAVVARLQGVDMEELTIDEVSLDESQSRITMVGVPDTPGVAARVFEEIAAAGVFVDMIVQSYHGQHNQATLTFTVAADKRDEAASVASRLAKQFHCQGITSSPHISKLSVSGVGLRSHTGVAIRMFRALSEAGINVEMINTSEVRVNVVVDGPQGRAARQRLQQAFADVLR